MKAIAQETLHVINSTVFAISILHYLSAGWINTIFLQKCNNIPANKEH